MPLRSTSLLVNTSVESLKDAGYSTSAHLVITPDGTEWLAFVDRDGTMQGLAETALEQFLEVADAPAAKVLRIAAAYGPLDVFRYLFLPATHPTHAAEPEQPRKDPGSHVYYEPVVAWRNFARFLTSLLCLGVDLTAGQPGRNEDWQALIAALPEKPASPRYVTFGSDDVNTAIVRDQGRGFYGAANAAGRAIEWQLRSVSYLVNHLFYASRVHISPMWLPDYRFQIGIDAVPGYRLAPILAIQVAAALTRGLYRCAECQRPYTLQEGQRRPQAKRKHYCSDACRHTAHNRVQLASWRQKSAKTQRLATSSSGA